MVETAGPSGSRDEHAGVEVMVTFDSDGRGAREREGVAISVVIPVVNGASTISDTIRDVATFLAGVGRPAEILVVDDGSDDGTDRLAREAGARAPVPVLVLRHESNRGKGAAVRTGMASARGDFRLFLDADLAYPAPEIASILEILEQGADVAVASRVHPESRYVIRPSFFRYLYTRHVSGRLFNWLVRLVLLPGISDTQAGLKGFRASAAEKLFGAWAPDGFGFDLAILARARRLGLSVVEVPVTFRYDREPTTLRFLADTARMLRDLAEVRVRIGLGGAVAGPGPADDARAIGSAANGSAPPAWLLAVLVAGIAAVEATRGRTANFLVPLALWLATVAALLVGARRRDRGAGVPAVRWFAGPGEVAVVLGITALGAALRLWALSDLPRFFHHDTAACGLVGQLLLEGAEKDPFGLAKSWYSFPLLGLVPYAMSLKLIGTSLIALRLTSAVPGILAVPVLYYLVRGWFGRVAAAVAAVLLATNHVAFHFSRSGIWNIHSLLLGLAGIAALAGGWRRRSALWLAAAGVCFGLSLHTYTAGRLFFGLGVLAAASLAAGAGRRGARPLSWLAAGLALAVLPLIGSYVRAPSALGLDRAASVNPFSAANRDHVSEQVGSGATSAILRFQVTRTLRGFTDLGDTDTNYGSRRPMIGAVTLGLFAAGLVFALARLPDPRFVFLLAWLGFGLVFGGVLALDPPSFPRLLAILPVPFVLAAVVLSEAWRKARSLGPVLRSAAAVAVVAVAVVALVTNVRGYRRFVERTEVAVNEWDVLEALAELRGARTVYLFTGYYMLADAPTFRLFREGRRLVTGMNANDLPEELGEPTAFVIAPDYRELGAELSRRFPDLRRRTKDSGGVRQLNIYTTTSCPVPGGEKESG